MNQDEWIGDLGDALAAVGRNEDACYMYRTAKVLDSSDGEWSNKVRACGRGSAPSIRSTSHQEQLMRRGAMTPEEQAGVIREHANQDEWLGDLGDKMRDAGRIQDACTLWRRALEIDTDDSEWLNNVSNCNNAGHTSSSSTTASVAPAATRRESAAVARMRSLYNQRRTDDEWLGDFGDALNASGNREEACLMWSEALAVDPTDSEWQNNISSCGGSVSMEQVIEFMREHYPHKRTDDEWLGDFGDVLLAAGSRPEACLMYREALVLDRTDSEWQTAVSNCNSTPVAAAQSTSRQQDLATAIVLTTAEQVRFIRNHSREDEWVGDLGDRLQSVGRKDACYLWRTAQALDDDDSEWQRKVASCEAGATPRLRSSAHQARLEEAGILTATEQRRLLANHRSDDEWLGDMGDLLSEVGRRSDACTLWRSAQALDANDSEWRNKISQNCR